jgi:hypothetical protein
MPNMYSPLQRRSHLESRNDVIRHAVISTRAPNHLSTLPSWYSSPLDGQGLRQQSDLSLRSVFTRVARMGLVFPAAFIIPCPTVPYPVSELRVTLTSAHSTCLPHCRLSAHSQQRWTSALPSPDRRTLATTRTLNHTRSRSRTRASKSPSTTTSNESTIPICLLQQS